MTKAKYATHHIDVYDVHLYVAANLKQWKAIRKRGATFIQKHPEAQGRSSFAVWTPNDGGLPQRVLVVYVDAALIGDDLPELSSRTSPTKPNTPPAKSSTTSATPTPAPTNPSAYLTGHIARLLWDQAQATKEAA